MPTIYTAIFGAYDDLKPPSIISKGWKYICFTDQDLKSDVWEIRKVPVMGCGPEKTARYYKIMFYKHIEDDFSIWVDGTFIINCNLNTWKKKFKKPFTTIKHPFDDCAYKEVESCLRMGKGDARIVRDQIACYHKLGLPKNNGLISSGILMREKTPEVKDFCRKWWNQVNMFSSRDQIAFAMVDFRLPGVHKSIEWNYVERTEFFHIPHLHKSHRQQQIEKYGKLKSVETRTDRTMAS